MNIRRTSKFQCVFSSKSTQRNVISIIGGLRHARSTLNQCTVSVEFSDKKYFRLNVVTKRINVLYEQDRLITISSIDNHFNIKSKLIDEIRYQKCQMSIII